MSDLATYITLTAIPTAQWVSVTSERQYSVWGGRMKNIPLLAQFSYTDQMI